MKKNKQEINEKDANMMVSIAFIIAIFLLFFFQGRGPFLKEKMSVPSDMLKRKSYTPRPKSGKKKTVRQTPRTERTHPEDPHHLLIDKKHKTERISEEELDSVLATKISSRAGVINLEILVELIGKQAGLRIVADKEAWAANPSVNMPGGQVTLAWLKKELEKNTDTRLEVTKRSGDIEVLILGQKGHKAN